MDAIELLLQRNSAPKLSEPAPQGELLDTILSAALRAPDHARLRPWRFITFSGAGRDKLGQLFADAARQREPDISDAAVDKVLKQPLRAPLLVAVIARIRPHDKVPEQEQLLSAGCAAHSILLAAQALGFAGIWRTGINAYDDTVKHGLGLQHGEQLVGYLYLGSIIGDYKPLAALALGDFVSSWS